MLTLVAQFTPIEASDGRVYSVQACGRQRKDGLWVGWLAFFDAHGGAKRTARETVQPTQAALEYWATGLTEVYLDGALRRAVAAAPPVAVTAPADSVHDEAASTSDERAVTLDTIAARSLTAKTRDLVTVESALTGHVVAVDPGLARMTIRAGSHLVTVTMEPPGLEQVRVGQRVTVTLSRA